MKIEVELSENAIQQIAERVDAIKKKKETTVYNVKQLSEMLGKNKRTIQRYFKDEILKGQRSGADWIITHENYLKHINGTD